MNLPHLTPLLLAAILLNACNHSAPKMTSDAYRSLIQQEGLVAYTPPQGNPASVMDWKKYGPGTIIRKGRFEYEQGAAFLIGEDGVKQAMDPAQAAPYHLFENKVVSGNQLDAKGGYTLQGVGDLTAQLGLKQDTEIEVKLGNTVISQPMALGDIRNLVKTNASKIDTQTLTNLRQGKSDVITAAVFTDSLTYTFKKKSENGASTALKVANEDLGSLTAKGYSTVDGSVVIPGSTFLYYRPLENVKELLAKP
jgi:hypothetical protein